MGVAWLTGCALHAAVAPAKAADTRPNVLIIFVDDLGYADLGCQGSKDVKTLRIDSLAADGVRCTAGYVSAPQCCPSRAGLLTGRYQNRFGFETNPSGDVTAGLPLAERTIADDLQAAGYATGMVGKWHLGTAPGMEPWQRGFAKSLWHPNGGVLFPDKRAGQLGDMRRGRDPANVRGYSTDAFGDAAADFITRRGAARAADGQPWFLYLAFVAPYWPMQAKPEHMAEFAAEPDLHRRTFLVMMASLDENVGKVLDALDATRQRDDTLVFFVSDNGGPTGRPRPRPDAPFQYGQNTSRNDPLRGTKGDLFEGGIRVPFIVRGPRAYGERRRSSPPTRRRRRLHLRLVLLRRRLPEGEEQRPSQVCLHVGQPRLDRHSSRPARRAASAALSRQGHSRDVREDRRPTREPLLLAFIVLADRRQALLPCLRPPETRESFGSVAATRAALDGLRAKAVAAGIPGVHVNAVVWGRPILPGEQAAVARRPRRPAGGHDQVLE